MSIVPTTADEWLEAVRREFETESDRAAAIVVAAMLDEALGLLLQKKLVSPVSRENSILDGSEAPLQSFSARINASFQLGLISRFMARDLHLIRKIRNEFAHEPLGRTFDSETIKARVTALEEASDYNKKRPDTRKALGPPGTRWDFLGIAAWILYDLHRDLEETEKLSEHVPEFGYIDWSSVTAGRLKALEETDEPT